MESLILLVNFKKAFDSINTKFINKKWVQLFFNARQTYLLLPGDLGDSIRLSQEVPQGDVLSTYIFNICVEMLLLKICYTKDLKGVKFAIREARTETFADDTPFFIKRALVKIIRDFSNISGLQANLDKITVVPLGGNYSINEEEQA